MYINTCYLYIQRLMIVHRIIIGLFVSIYIVISTYYLQRGLLNEPNLTVLIAIKLDNTVGLLGVLRSRM